MVVIAMSNIVLWTSKDSLKDVSFVEHIIAIKTGIKADLNGIDFSYAVRRKVFLNKNKCVKLTQSNNCATKKCRNFVSNYVY